MKKFPAKWKVFLVLNYVQLISYGFFLIVMTIGFFKDNHMNARGRLYFCIAALTFLLFCLNNFLSIYAVHRYFPDTLIPRKNKIFMKITGIINILLSAGILVLCIAGLVEELSYQGTRQDRTGLVILAVLFFLWAIGVYTLILQFGMFRFLKRNNEVKLASLINSIGTE